MATQTCVTALRGKIKPTQMWRRERANVTHDIIQNVILIVQGDFRKKLAIIQRNWVRTRSGYRSPQKSGWKFRSVSHENRGKFLQGHPNGAGKSDPSVLILSLGFVWHRACIFLHSSWIWTLSCAFLYPFVSVWAMSPVGEFPALYQWQIMPCPCIYHMVVPFLLVESALLPFHAGLAPRGSWHCLWVSVPGGEPLHSQVGEHICVSMGMACIQANTNS